jgi:hypothetical protein
MGTSYDAYTNVARKSAFGHNGAARLRDIIDGTSNSMLIIETPTEKDSPIRGPFWAAYVATAAMLPYDYKINQPTSATDPRSQYCAPGSKHIGGCHVLLGDGAIRFLSENINLTTQRSLVSIAGGELLGEF